MTEYVGLEPLTDTDLDGLDGRPLDLEKLPADQRELLLDALGVSFAPASVTVTAPHVVQPGGLWPALRFRTAQERSAERPARVDWVIGNLAARGAVTELDGAQKLSGKTTFLAHAIAAKLDGLMFLGHPTLAGPVVWLTEESWATMQEPLRETGMLQRNDLHILCRDDTFGVPWEEVARQARVKVAEVGAQLLIGDTLTSLAGLKGDTENAAGDSLSSLQPVQEIAATGIAVLVTRHDRRAGGEVGESGRGSTAFSGAVDMVFRLTRMGGDGRDSMRKLEYVGRLRGVEASRIVDRTPTGYHLVGTESDVKRREARALLLEHLPDSEAEAVTLPSLLAGADAAKGRPAGPLAGSGVGKTTLREVAEELERAGSVGHVEVARNRHLWWCMSGARGVTGRASTDQGVPVISGARGVTGRASGMSGGEAGAASMSGGPPHLRGGHTGRADTDACAPDDDNEDDEAADMLPLTTG